MKKRMRNVLFELLKNSKKSDRDIAKKLKVSQPTITRTRKKLENLGYVREYTIIPEFPKLGFELVAFIFFNVKRHENEKGKERAHKWIEKHPNVIFATYGDGIHGKNGLIVSIHKNFTEYSDFVYKLKKIWGKDISDLDAFLASLKSEMPKHISFRPLGKAI